MQRPGLPNRYGENYYEDVQHASASKHMANPYNEIKKDSIPYELNALINRS